MSEAKFTKGRVYAHFTRIVPVGKVAGIATTNNGVGHDNAANAARLAHCWNCHDELVDALEKIQMTIGYIVIHGIGVREPRDGVPQPVAITGEELKALIHEIGDTARAAIAHATSAEKEGK